MTSVLTDEKIPNNVNLASDKRLQRALEAWQPAFIDWWKEMGPTGWQEKDIFLRTAVSVENDGWAHFDYVKMPDYRWGIFLEPKDPNRVHGFGDNRGKPVWDEVPGEFPTCCAASSSRRVTPSPRASSSSATSARPRHRSTICATCFR